MKAVIITIGNEILSGLTIDTNSVYLGKELGSIGIPVCRKISVGDKSQNIIEAVMAGLKAGHLVICTGGLGPTSDDLTLKVLAKHFNRKLILNQSVFEYLKSRFAKKGVGMPACNKKQALVPEKSKVLFNSQGTAPGILFNLKNKKVILLPGVPREVKAIWQERLKDLLRESGNHYIISRALRTAGIPESAIAEKLSVLEKTLKPGVLAYLPGHLGVDLRVTLHGADQKTLNRQANEIIRKIKIALKHHIYGCDKQTLEQTVGLILKKKKLSLSLAESCTGGLVGDRITNVPGSSLYFKGGVVAYGNQIKQNMLGVKAQTLLNHGAVSVEAVREMALGARKIFKSDIGLSISGIAGPDGGCPLKPVGLVFIGISGHQEIKVFEKRFLGPRRQIKEMAAQIALNELRLYLTSV
ncbi:competence/damage-inducible protein A [candidate division TA06 bacterium]|uniref:CinA-like protein n=1 Tax=candidate division TA06 bacterium TaxID=2250710 RepID=A0A933IDM5_UNCT6|nr:competence/damage-inducible protein A [candidate division TA06 bacterium]